MRTYLRKKEYPWKEVYQDADFKKLCKKIRVMLANPSMLYSYYPIARIFKRNNLRFNKSIELGAGTGQFSLILKKLGFIKEVYLVDIEKGALEMAKNLFKEFDEECNIIHSDLLDLKEVKEYKNQSFDVCFSGGLIEHFIGHEQEEVIKTHLDIAKEVILQFPYDSKTYWAMRNIITKTKGKWPFGYEYPLSRRDTFKVMNNFAGKKWRIKDEDYHYLLPILLSKTPFNVLNIPLRCYPFLRLFPMDYVIYCTQSKYKMLSDFRD